MTDLVLHYYQNEETGRVCAVDFPWLLGTRWTPITREQYEAQTAGVDLSPTPPPSRTDVQKGTYEN